MSDASHADARRGSVSQEELAKLAREQERRRRSSSSSREEIRLRRLIAWLCLFAFLVAGALAVVLVEIVIREDTARRLAVERERAVIQRELAEQQATLDRESDVAHLAAESLQRFAMEFRDIDLQTRLDAAGYYAELAPDEATATRWLEIVAYLEALSLERLAEYEELQAALNLNRQRYVAAVNQVIASGEADPGADEKIAALEGEAAALMAGAKRLARDLGALPQAGAEKRSDLTGGTTQATSATGASGPPAPMPLAPRDGTIFGHYPQKTMLAWTPIPEAASYTLEVDCFDCCAEEQWCNDVGREYLTVPNLEMTRFSFDFGGEKQGRWRVWSVSPGGESGPKSDWSQFSFAK